jgi:hypothetical protein
MKQGALKQMFPAIMGGGAQKTKNIAHHWSYKWDNGPDKA